MNTPQSNEHREQARADNPPPLQTLYAMFEEWRTSFPPEHRPERDAPHTEQLIDAWIAGFAKHNEITCAAQLRSAAARPVVAADARNLVCDWRDEWRIPTPEPGTPLDAQSDLIQRIAAYASQRDAEVREVLEGLINKRSDSLHLHWCHPSENCNYACAAARDLYSKLQATELQKET